MHWPLPVTVPVLDIAGRTLILINCGALQEERLPRRAQAGRSLHRDFSEAESGIVPSVEFGHPETSPAWRDALVQPWGRFWLVRAGLGGWDGFCP